MSEVSLSLAVAFSWGCSDGSCTAALTVASVGEPNSIAKGDQGWFLNSCICAVYHYLVASFHEFNISAEKGWWFPLSVDWLWPNKYNIVHTCHQPQLPSSPLSNCSLVVTRSEMGDTRTNSKRAYALGGWVKSKECDRILNNYCLKVTHCLRFQNLWWNLATSMPSITCSGRKQSVEESVLSNIAAVVVNQLYFWCGRVQLTNNSVGSTRWGWHTRCYKSCHPFVTFTFFTSCHSIVMVPFALWSPCSYNVEWDEGLEPCVSCTLCP